MTSGSLSLFRKPALAGREGERVASTPRALAKPVEEKREGGAEGWWEGRKMRGWRRTRGGDKNIDENYKHKHVYVSEGQGRKQMIKEARWWLMMTMTCMLTYQGCS